MTNLKDELAYLFNHLEHHDDEVGVKMVEDILDLLDVSKLYYIEIKMPYSKTWQPYFKHKYYKTVSIAINAIEGTSKAWSNGTEFRVKTIYAC